jgi:hypothetical protein
MKVMVCHFVSDSHDNSHEVMTALIVMLPLIVVVEIFSATSSIFIIHGFFPSAPTIAERRTTLAKAYGIKVRCYLGTLLGGRCQELENSSPLFSFFYFLCMFAYGFQ